MKKRLLFFGLFLILIVISCHTTKEANKFDVSGHSIRDTTGNLASFNGDTTAYLNFIVSKKQDYIGKPLSKFLNDLEVPIISFSTSVSQRNKSESYGILIQTGNLKNYYNEVNKSNIHAYRIGILWQSLQPMDSVRAVMEYNKKAKETATKWSLYANDYFGKIIVGDIKLPYYLVK